MSQEAKIHYCLDKLIGFVGNDPDAINHMVQLFLNTTPEMLDTIDRCFKGGNAVDLAKTAHSLKPTLDIFGVQHTHDLIRSIEQKARNSELDDNLAAQIDQLLLILDQVFQELKAAFPKS